MANFERFDEVVKEYLLLRGFSTSYRSFENELKNEKDKGFKVDKIMEQVHISVNNHDLLQLRDLWNVLDSRLFSRLDSSYATAVRKLESSLLKHYVVNCVQSNRSDKVQEFLEKISSELQGQLEWREWFMLPWCKCPEEDRTFSMYFTKQWQDTLYLSLHNFLSVIVQAMPAPRLLAQDAEINKIKKLEEENAKLRQQVKDLTERKHASNVTPASLSETLLSPSGALSGPSAMDLMDDFYVIAQDTQIEDTPKQKSQPIKAILSSIGRSSPGTTRKQLDDKKAVSSGPKNGAKPRVTAANTISANKTQEATYNRSRSEPSKSSAPNTAASRTNASGSSTSPSTKTSPKVDRPKSMNINTIPSTVANTPPATRPKERKPEVSSRKPDNVDGVGPTTNDRPSQPDIGPTVPTQELILQVPTRKPPFSLLSQEEYKEHQSCVTHCCFSGTGHSVATIDIDGVVKIWGLQPSPVTNATVMSKSMLQCVEWVGKTDKWLLLGSKAGSVRLFDVNKKQIEKEATVDDVYVKVSAMSCTAQGTRFTCASGRQKSAPVTQNGGCKLTVWDLDTMTIDRVLLMNPCPPAINCVCYNDCGQLILTGGSDGVIRLYDEKDTTGECSMQWKAHEGDVYTVEYGKKSVSCFSMGADGQFVEWSLLKPGEKLSSFPIHTGAAGPFTLSGPGGFRHVQVAKGKLFAFNSNQDHVVTCANDGGCIYSVEQTKDGKHAECVMLLKGHKAPVLAVDWSASVDTMTCLSASIDGKVRVSTLLAH